MALPNNPGPGKKPPLAPQPTLSLASQQGHMGPVARPPGLQRLMPLQQHPPQAHPPIGEMSPTQFQGQGGIFFGQANQTNQIHNNNTTTTTSLPQQPYIHDTLHNRLVSIVNNRQGKLHRDVSGIIQNYNASMEQDMSFIVNTFIQTKADLERAQQENKVLREVKDQAAAEIVRLREAGGKANTEIGRLNEAGCQVQTELIRLRRLYQMLYNSKVSLAGVRHTEEEAPASSGAAIPWNNVSQHIELDSISPVIHTTIPAAIPTTTPTTIPTTTTATPTTATPTTATPTNVASTNVASTNVTSAAVNPTTPNAVNGVTSLPAVVNFATISDECRIIELDSPGQDAILFEDESVVISDIEMVSKELIRATEDIAHLKNENKKLLDRLEKATRRGDKLQQALITRQAVNKSLSDLYESRSRSLTEKSMQVEQTKTQLEQAKADLAKFYGLMATATANLKSAHNFMFTHYGAIAKSVAEKQKQQGSQFPGTPTQPLSLSPVQTAESVMRTLETTAVETAKAASSVQDPMRPIDVSGAQSQTQQLHLPPVGSFGSSALAPPPVHTFRPTNPANSPLSKQQGSKKPTSERPPTPTQATFGHPKAHASPALLEPPIPTSNTLASPLGRPQVTPWTPSGASSGRPPTTLQSLGPAVHSFIPTTPAAPVGQVHSQTLTAGIHSFKSGEAIRSVATPVTTPQHLPGPLPALGTFSQQSNQDSYSSRHVQPKMTSPLTVIDLTTTDNPSVVPGQQSPKAESHPSTGETSAPSTEPVTSPSFVKQLIPDSTEPIVTATLLQHTGSDNASQETAVSVREHMEQRSGMGSSEEGVKETLDALPQTQQHPQHRESSDIEKSGVDPDKQNTVTPPNKVSTPSNGQMAWMKARAETTASTPLALASVSVGRTNPKHTSGIMGPSSASGGPDLSIRDNVTEISNSSSSSTTLISSSGAATTESMPSKTSNIGVGVSLLKNNIFSGPKGNGRKGPLSHAEKQAKAERVVAAKKRHLAKTKAFEEMLAVTESKNQSHGNGNGISSSPISKAALQIQSESVKKSNADTPLDDSMSGEDGQSPSSPLPPPLPTPVSSSLSPCSSSQTKTLETQPAMAEKVQTTTLARSSFVKLPGHFYLSAVEIPIRKKVQLVKRTRGSVSKKPPVKAPAKRKWVDVSDSDDDYQMH